MHILVRVHGMARQVAPCSYWLIHEPKLLIHSHCTWEFFFARWHPIPERGASSPFSRCWAHQTLRFSSSPVLLTNVVKFYCDVWRFRSEFLYKRKCESTNIYEILTAHKPESSAQGAGNRKKVSLGRRMNLFKGRVEKAINSKCERQKNQYTHRITGIWSHSVMESLRDMGRIGFVGEIKVHEVSGVHPEYKTSSAFWKRWRMENVTEARWPKRDLP